MSRHRSETPTELDPVIAAELHALEAALAGAPSADPELLALVAAVRADAPAPEHAFRRELDARVAAGFPPAGGPRAWLATAQGWAGAHRRLLLPALGAAASLLIVLLVAAASLHGGGAGRPAGAGVAGAPQAVSAERAPSAGAAGAAAAPAAPAGGGTTAGPPPARSADSTAKAVPAPSVGASTAPSLVTPAPPITLPGPTPVPPGTPRKVERSTQLALRTSADRLQTVADGVVRVTQAAGGFVQQSSVDATDQGGTADFQLSVPSAQADAVLARLSRLAHVSSLSQSSTDITAGFVSTAAQLADARAERRALLKALAGARTPAGIARLKARIAANHRQIALLEAQRRDLRRRADNTTIVVTVTARGAAPRGTGHGGGGWTPRDAAHDALRVLEVAAGVLLIALAVTVPLGLLALPALFGARAARRRRREHALDPA